VKIYTFREGPDNLGYLIHCEASGEAAVVDPGSATADRMGALGLPRLRLRYIIDTHRHSDHVSGNAAVQEAFGGEIVCSEAEAEGIPTASLMVRDRDVLQLGNIRLVFLITPGHTPGGMCIIADSEAIFTGDTLFIGDCGRTDLPGGSESELFESMQRLRQLPDSLTIYPGHDYGESQSDLLGNQKKRNKCLLADNLVAFSRL